jgi:hypothetical protein
MSVDFLFPLWMMLLSAFSPFQLFFAGNFNVNIIENSTKEIPTAAF